ncbi:Transposase, Rhodopirellula-type, partial [mine drainage metagenome]
TSKWNRIEHRLFSHIAMNWRGKPLVSLAVIVSLIGATTSTAGLWVRSELDKGRYPEGVKVSDEEMAQVLLEPHEFHGDWNYTIRPHRARMK